MSFKDQLESAIKELDNKVYLLEQDLIKNIHSVDDLSDKIAEYEDIIYLLRVEQDELKKEKKLYLEELKKY